MSAELKADGTVELRIEREFAYSPEKVFEAWLQPEQLAIWMGPNDDINVSNVQINATEGGSYHMQFNESDGTMHKLNGIYQTIRRYTRLVFTWIWEEPIYGDDDETLVTVDFEPTEKGTKLVLQHQKFTTVESRDRHDQGWCGTLDKFEKHAEQIFAE